MPTLTYQISALGPLLDVEIGVSGPRRDALHKAGLAIPSNVAVRALIDTGASCTGIDKAIIAALQLVSKGPIPVHTPTTGQAPKSCEQYDIHLRLIHPKLSFTFAALPVIETDDLSVQGIQGLIGRDVLRSCIFIFNGENGTYSLAF